MGKLNEVFKDVTELEMQLLTVLPNLVTIPFILCSGKICTPRNEMFILGIGLGIYTITGVLYFFATSMIQLILLSCLLGRGLRPCHTSLRRASYRSISWARRARVSWA